jgi:two-component system KDP operon response regulator KdpE
VSPAPSALLVEDEPEIRRFVRTALEVEGWTVNEAATMREGLVDAGTTKPDLVILDLGLPDGDGNAFIREVRGWSGLPIIVLSARAQETDKVEALDAGADDYLTKPFGMAELLARVRAALRRRSAPEGAPKGIFRFGEVEVDLGARSVKRKGEAVHVTPVEYRLLQLLIANAGKVLTHRFILREVWGPSHVEHNHYVRVYMQHLRQKLEDDPARPRHLTTETAVGYRLIT